MEIKQIGKDDILYCINFDNTDDIFDLNYDSFISLISTIAEKTSNENTKDKALKIIDSLYESYDETDNTVVVTGKELTILMSLILQYCRYLNILTAEKNMAISILNNRTNLQEEILETYGVNTSVFGIEPLIKDDFFEMFSQPSNSN